MTRNGNKAVAHLEPRTFYESAIAAIQTANSRNERRLYLAKIHGVSEPRPEPKPMATWVIGLMHAVEDCIRSNWDVRIIERIENRDRLGDLIQGIKRFDASTAYLVKGVRGTEGLPFLNLLIAGSESVFLALDDPRYRLARMGLNLSGIDTIAIFNSYWEDLWERCPYWIRKASGLFAGPGGIDDLRQYFERSAHNPAFVAMWFGDARSIETKSFMARLYEQAIQSAIERAGYKAIRVDLMPHNEFIMERVLKLIRQAPFVVADFTGNRNGVYFEAGFARGIGIPVIHSCRRSHFEAAHFDIKQINTIVWETPEQLTDELYQRILQSLGQGPGATR